MSACVCGSGAELEACCGPLHAGLAQAQTAEALMRSRYAAFASGDVDYLAATQVKPFAEGKEKVAAWAKGVLWLGLEVLAREAGGPADDAGFVTFAARYLENGEVVTMQERSRFDRAPSEAPPARGKWRYVEGQLQVKKARAERNSPCPCGSGKKFKHCHA
jgi:SEC-C motif-containing protein